MKLIVLAAGRHKEDVFRAPEAEYEKRLRRYAPVEVREVKDEPALLAALPPRAKLLALDSRGAPWSTEDLAAFLRKEALFGAGAPLVFAIGGPDGHTDTLRRLAAHTISFGKITLPHRLARVILLEQLYRAHTILRGEPYHR